MDVNGKSSASLSMALDTRVTVNVDAQPTDASRKLDDALLKWLDGLSCVAKQEEISTLLRQPDTCTWLLSTSEYQSWRRGDHALLWLHGKPGSGKTVLASFVVDALKEERDHREALAYYYCDFRRARSTSAAEVMRSILSQLLCHIRHVNAVPRELANNIVKDRDITPVLYDVWGLTRFVLQTATRLEGQPVVIVDALDECKDVVVLLHGLRALAEGGMRLFVTSRFNPVIKDSLRGFPSILMDNMTRPDIDLHLQRELDSRQALKDLEPKFKMEIHATLCARAEGMFRWVQCQIDALDRCATKDSIQEALDDLPAGLDEMYERCLVAIDVSSPKGELALRVLALLIAALRPLQSREVLAVLAMYPGSVDHDVGSVQKSTLLEACGNLVTYNERTDVLLLPHSSAKEYLTRSLTRVKFPRCHINYQAAHEQLARICIRYLGLYLTHAHVPGSNFCVVQRWSQVSEFPESTPMSGELVDYVFSHSFNHLAFLGEENRIVLQDLAALALDIQRSPNSWKEICRMSGIPWVSEGHDFISYIITAYASPSFHLAFLCRRPTPPKYQTNPLLYAVHFDKLKHAELLLLHGADVNRQGWVVDAPRLASPLEIAIGRRNETMVRLFLSAGGTVPERLFPLTTYYRNYPFRLVRMLLETDDFEEWALDPRHKLPSPLRILGQQPSLALEMDTLCIIRRLVQLGVDLAEEDVSGKTVLDFAVLGGYKAIALYLLLISTPRPSDFMLVVSKIRPTEQIPFLRLALEAGFDVDGHLPGNDTAFHLAIMFFEGNCLEVVKILTDAGGDPFARTADGKTPLHLALKKGDIPVAEYLLSQGMPPSDTLIAVVECRCPTRWRLDTLRALVDAGTDVDGIIQHARRFLGASALYDPSSSWSDITTDLALDPSLILDYLLESVSREPPFPGALFAVLRSGFPTPWKTLVVCSLVGKEVDVRAPSSDGDTLLHVAVRTLDECAGLEIAQYLVRAGCDPFRPDSRGQTPLHIAAEKGYLSVVEYILSQGSSLPDDILYSVLESPTKTRVSMLNIFIKEGPNVHFIKDSGNLLHTAIRSFSFDSSIAHSAHGGRLAHQEFVKMQAIVETLIENGCEAFAPDQQGQTPLHLAVAGGYVPIVMYLLSIPTRPFLPPDILIYAPDWNATHTSWEDTRTILRLLVENGANVDVQDMEGNSLLHMALKYPYSMSLRHPSWTTILSLHDAREGWPESRDGDLLQLIQAFVETGCEPSLCDANGRPPVYLAMTQGLVNVVEYLLPISVHPLEELSDAIDVSPIGFRGQLRELLDVQRFEQLTLWESCQSESG